MAPPKEFAPNTRSFDQNIETASVTVAVGQKLTKHASDPPDKINKYFTSNRIPESGGDQNNRDKLEGVWV